MRLYNGAPDSELKAVWDENARIRAEARSLGIFLTYFPAEGMYGASTSMQSDAPIRSLGELRSSLAGALEEGKKHLSEKKP